MSAQIAASEAGESSARGARSRGVAGSPAAIGRVPGSSSNPPRPAQPRGRAGGRTRTSPGANVRRQPSVPDRQSSRGSPVGSSSPAGTPVRPLAGPLAAPPADALASTPVELVANSWLDDSCEAGPSTESSATVELVGAFCADAGDGAPEVTDEGSMSEQELRLALSESLKENRQLALRAERHEHVVSDLHQELDEKIAEVHRLQGKDPPRSGNSCLARQDRLDEIEAGFRAHEAHRDGDCLSADVAAKELGMLRMRIEQEMRDTEMLLKQKEEQYNILQRNREEMNRFRQRLERYEQQLRQPEETMNGAEDPGQWCEVANTALYTLRQKAIWSAEQQSKKRLRKLQFLRELWERETSSEGVEHVQKDDAFSISIAVQEKGNEDIIRCVHEARTALCREKENSELLQQRHLAQLQEATQSAGDALERERDLAKARQTEAQRRFDLELEALRVKAQAEATTRTSQAARLADEWLRQKKEKQRLHEERSANLDQSIEQVRNSIVPEALVPHDEVSRMEFLRQVAEVSKLALSEMEVQRKVKPATVARASSAERSSAVLDCVRRARSEEQRRSIGEASGLSIESSMVPEAVGVKCSSPMLSPASGSSPPPWLPEEPIHLTSALLPPARMQRVLAESPVEQIPVRQLSGGQQAGIAKADVAVVSAVPPAPQPQRQLAGWVNFADIADDCRNIAALGSSCTARCNKESTDVTSSILSPRYNTMRQASPPRQCVPGTASTALGMRGMVSSLRGAAGGGFTSFASTAVLASPLHGGSLRGAAVSAPTWPLFSSPQRQSSGPQRQSSNPLRPSSGPHRQFSGPLGAGRTPASSAASISVPIGNTSSYPMIVTPRSPSPQPRRGGISLGEGSALRQASAGQPRGGSHWVLEGRDAVVRERWRNVENGEIAQRLTS